MLTTNNNLEQNIQQWVTIDNQLKLLSDKTKELRDKKNILAEKICSENEDLSVKISDGRLRVVQTRETQPLTFKFLETCLSEIIKNEISKFKSELMGSNFVIDNPNATNKCGCGSSFAV